MQFTGIARPEEFRTVTRAHVIAWRDDLRQRLTRHRTPWSDTSIRHRLSALAARTAESEACALVDAQDSFDPAAAVAS